MKQIAVVLSGCGFQDGSEITEAVSGLIALSQCGAEARCFAPDLAFQATDHLTQSADGERQVLNESARIARGQIENLKNLDPQNFDAIIFPGGFGAAKNLCNWASQGAKAQVHPEVERVVRGFHQESKPIGAFCIAPVILARVLGSENITVTIGHDRETALEIEKTGAHHESCAVDDFITDREHKIVTTPAYMYDAPPAKVFAGIQAAVRELVEMA